MAQQNLLRFPEVRRPEWSNDELSELYRVQNALLQAGIEVQIERGQTDEGDPWFVFCRSDGETVVQIARSEGLYYLYASVLSAPLVGSNFAELAKRLVDLMPAPVRPKAGTLFLHPSSLLSILVASLFVTSDLMNSSSAFAGLSQDADAREIAETITYPVARSVLVETASDSVLSTVDAPSILSGTQKVQDVLLRSAEQNDRREGSQNHSVQLATVLSEALVIGAYIAARLNANPPAPVVAVEPSSHRLTLQTTANDGPVSLGVSLDGRSSDAATESALTGGGPVSQTPFIVSTTIIAPLSMAGRDPIMFQTEMHVPQLPSASVASASAVLATDMTTVSLAQLAHLPISGTALPSLAAERAAANTVGQVVTSHMGGNVALELSGGAIARVTDVAHVDADSGMMSFQLRISSIGELSNVVYIPDDVLKVHSTVDVVVSGTQDLEIHESVSVFLRSTLNTSNFNADLSLGIVFGNNTSNTETLNIGTSNFDIRPGDSIALYELPDETSIQVNSSIKVLSMVAMGATTTRDASLNIDLSSVTSGKSLTFGEIRAYGVDDLHLQSLGKNESVVHTVETLKAADASLLMLSGNADLVINRFEVAAYNTHDVTIDARGLASGLTMQLSDFDHGKGETRQINVLASQDGTWFADPNINHQISFAGGNGIDVLVIASGEHNDSVREFETSDVLVLNGWSVLENLTSVSGLSSSFQSVIDSEITVTDAARAAAHLHVFAHSAVAEGPTAWLFTYRDATYVFADRIGDGNFDGHTDAVVQLIGYVPTQAHSVDTNI